MNTQLTEEQLVHIKKSLENSLELVKRGLKHFSSVDVHTNMSNAIKDSLDDPNSYYFLHPEYLFHFQDFELWIEIRYKNKIYYVETSHFIPKHDTQFTRPVFLFNAYFNSLDDAKLCPPRYLEKLYNACSYGSFENLDDAIKLYHKFVYQVLCYDDVSLELPF